MLRYLFCVVSARDAPDLEGWTGAGAPLALVRADGLAGVVGAVAEEQFGSEALSRALHDVAAISPYATMHQDVVQFVFERTPSVVPITFGSVHDSDDDVRRSLERERARLIALLERFRERQEWGLRLARRRARVPVAAGEPGAGTTYLASRRAELRGELAGDARRAAEDLDATLARASVARRELAEAGGDLVLRVAYLIAARDVDAVKRAVLDRGSELERLGLAAELSGPWPPYSFVDRGDAA